MRGKKPKPTSLRLIEGNREHRTIHDENEPRPERKAPPRPKELDVDERKAWRYLVKELDKMGTLATSDRANMTAYCHAWGVWIRAKRKLNELAKDNPDCEIIMTDKGNWIQNPWLSNANRGMADVVKYGSFLGLDPTSRTRIKTEVPETKSLRDELLA
jgi:P27 family predicted phage terminase small subunit